MSEITLLKKLISIDSQCTKSNHEIVQYLKNVFKDNATKITKIKKGDLDIYNLQVTIKGETSTNPIIFSGHTDTVPVSSNWTKDPFKPEIIGQKLYGLGSTDMKSGLAAFITAVKSLKSKPKRDIILLFDADEEDSGIGGKVFAKNVKIKGKADIIVGEATGGNIVAGQKGDIDLKVTCFGKSMHSSRIDQKINDKNNAINKAIKIINEINKLNRNLSKIKNKNLGFPTQAITTINGGTAVNVLPNECSFMINRRLVPEENINKVFAQYKKLIKRSDPGAKVEITFWGESNQVNVNHPLIKKIETITRKHFKNSKIQYSPGWSQAGMFKIWGSSIEWGPGEKTMTHQADEYCDIRKVKKMTQCYKELIES